MSTVMKAFALVCTSCITRPPRLTFLTLNCSLAMSSLCASFSVKSANLKSARLPSTVIVKIVVSEREDTVSEREDESSASLDDGPEAACCGLDCLTCIESTDFVSMSGCS
eukprot:5158656-Prymnesium_polylepis.2